MWTARRVLRHFHRPVAVSALAYIFVVEDDALRDTVNGIPLTSCAAMGVLWGGVEMSERPTLHRQSTTQILQQTANSDPVERLYRVNWQVPIGSGMFGDVFEAEHRNSKEKVAIKKIPKKYTSNDTFEREMDNLLYLEQTGGHPSICLMRDHFVDDSHFYLVLDLIEGEELFDHLCQHGAYSEADAARLIRQTASALAFLHGIGVVHSDLKPENLMLSSKDDKQANVKIVDFGCAHRIDEEDGHTEHRGTGLTPAYCPPEVLGPKKRNPDEHCDIAPSFDMWSLGCILYVILTGVHPYDLKGTATNEEMEEKIIAGQRPPTRDCKYTKYLSDEAIQVIENLMDRNPEKRMTAQELLNNPWVKGETASSSIIKGSHMRLWEYRRNQTKIASTIFKGLLKNSTKHGGSQLAKRTSILEMAFRDLDPKNRGYISTKELNGVTSMLAADAKVSLNELQHLLKEKMAQHHFPKEKIIYKEATLGDSMYFVQSGSVEVKSRQDGFKTVRGAGDFFGEDALLAGQDGTYSQTAKCLTPVHVLEITREHFEKYLQSDEDVEMTLAETDRKRQRERAKVIFGLQDGLKPLTVNSGQIIFREGDRGDILFIKESGNVDISVGGRKVRSLRTGEMTGEHAAFYAHKAYNVTAQCIDQEGCKMQMLHGKQIRKMCKNNKDLEESFRDIILRRDFKKAVVNMTKKDFPETEEELRAVFDAIDTAESGAIEFGTLKRAVMHWDSEYTEKDIRDMLKSLDLKGTGKLTWADFKRIFSMFNDM